ncbi:hypothetical protein ERE07_02555 [Allopusillimonas ginsengisoli]|nr:hypothetical protein ERE07_02555 [Allopusillimonas ginsengisoli]
MASGSLGRLNVILGLNAAEFTRGMGRAEYQARKSLDQIASSARTVQNTLRTVFAGYSVKMVYDKFLTETINAQNEQAQLTAVLKSTGQAAGYTRDELNKMAADMSGIFSEGEINKAQTTLLAFTGIVGDQFTQALQAAIDMSARTGMSVVQAAETIGRALDVPSKGLSSLSKQGFRFTEEQKKLAERLEATGRTAEAQGIILNELTSSYGGAAQAARDTLGGALTALRNQIDSLMTGDDGSVNGLTGAVNDLTDSLGSEDTKQTFKDFTGWLAETAKYVLNLTNQFAEGIRYSDGFFDALVKYGLTDPFKSPLEQLERINKELDTLNKDTKGLVSSIKDGSVSIFDVDPTSLGGEGRASRMRALLQEQQYWQRQLERGERDLFQSYKGFGETGGDPFSGVLPPVSVRPSSTGGKKGKAVKTKVDPDPLGTFIKEQQEATQAYFSFLDDISGETEKRRVEQQKRFLDDALGLGRISADEYAKYMDEIATKGKETMDNIDQFTVQAARNIESALGDGLYQVLTGKFDNIAADFADMLAHMAAQAVAANIAGSLFGDYGSSGKIGGFIGSLLGFASGGYTGPGGRTEPAGIVHKGEYVLNQDATRRVGVGVLDRINKGYASGGLVGGSSSSSPTSGDVNVTVNVTENEASTQGDPSQFGRTLANAVRNTVQEELVRAKMQGGQLWQGGY